MRAPAPRAALVGVLGVTEPPVSNVKLGVWLFLASEVMFFTGLIGAYIVLRFASPQWPAPGETLNIPVTGLNTFFLICSSVTMVLAYAAGTRGEPRRLRGYLAATAAIGALFLAIQALEYRALLHHGLTPWGSLYGSCFFTLTGFHGAHVLGGVIWVLVATVRACLGQFTRQHHDGVEVVGLYWHFVDLVWIILFTIVYLI